MSIKTRPQYRTASDIIDAIMNEWNKITQDEIQKKLWKTEVQKNVYIEMMKEAVNFGEAMTEGKVKIARVPQNFFEKILLFFWDLQMVIDIEPVNRYVRFHSVEINLIFGNRQISKRDSRLVRMFYQKDIDGILSILKKNVREINTIPIE